MPEISMIQKYADYLEILNKKLDSYFEDQKEFIKCKAGCSLCCKSSYYPYSQLEYDYFRIGFNKNFNEKQREEINKKALQIFKDRKIFLKTNSNVFDFHYECPFLVNDSCGNYQHRGLLCRSHGLIYKDVDKPKHNAPHCMTLGYNYSDIYDPETKQFSEEKAVQLGFKARPQVYELSYSSIMKDAGEDFEFGDVRMLFEWVVMDIPNYEELIKSNP